MIQFNLLPDVKLEYIHTRRRKRTVLAFSALITSVSLTILVITFLVANVWQKVTLDKLDTEIKAHAKTLQETPDIDKILTIQNQLNSLPGLHDQKPVASRLFTYLSQTTPSQATISRMQVNFDANTMTLSGGAESIEIINKFVDTLKFTQYATIDTPEPINAFTDVVLTNFGRDEKTATYTINLVFDPAIFAGSSEDIKLIVPQLITTRSETERPTELFKETTPPPSEQVQP